MAENQCIFKGKFHCDDKGDLMKAGPARIQTIIKFSKEYKDDIHITHAEKLSDDPSLYIECHSTVYPCIRWLAC